MIAGGAVGEPPVRIFASIDSVCQKFLPVADFLNPPKSPFFKGGLSKDFEQVPPFGKGGLGGI
jgi:hypothetical protein